MYVEDHDSVNDTEPMSLSILRVLKRETFTSIDNRLLRDKRLSFAARGLMGYLLSKPNDWEVNVKDLINQSPAGRDAAYSLLTELAKFLYIARIKRKGPRGYFIYETVVSEVPLTEDIIEQLNRQNPLTPCPEVDGPETPGPESVHPKAVSPDYKEIQNQERLSNERSNNKTMKRAGSGASAGVSSKRDLSLAIVRVFTFWQEHLSDIIDTSRYALTTKRKRMIGGRLRSKRGWTEADLMDGIRGLKLSDWHMARHPKNTETIYADPKYVFIDDDTLEKRIATYRAYSRVNAPNKPQEPCVFCDDTGVVNKPAKVPENIILVPSESWFAAKDKLKAQLQPDVFEKWFESVSCAGVNCESVYLKVPNALARDWIVSNYSEILFVAIAEAFAKPFQVLWLCDEQVPCNHSGS